MDSQTITISLPTPIYRRVEQQSQLMQRSIAEELVAVVIAYTLTGGRTIALSLLLLSESATHYWYPSNS